MARKKLAEQLTAEQLRDVLDYDPDTGLFRWRAGIYHWRAGLPAGTEGWCGSTRRPYVLIGLGTTSKGIQNRRYVLLGIKKKVYRAHRLAWLHVYGRWPKGEIDHINGNGCDNRIVNLREATTSQNGMNRGLRVDNTSGHKGISWNKKSSQWLAHIGYRGKIVHLGLFDTIEEAKTVRDDAARRLHGAFARIE
jgi:hypothetical protein